MGKDMEDFASMRERLDRIADEVGRDDIDFDDALTLFEEAIGLGLRACDMSEIGLEEEVVEETTASEESVAEEGSPSDEGTDAVPPVDPAASSSEAAVALEGTERAFPDREGSRVIS